MTELARAPLDAAPRGAARPSVSEGVLPRMTAPAGQRGARVIPSWTDPLVASASRMVGGPLGIQMSQSLQEVPNAGHPH